MQYPHGDNVKSNLKLFGFYFLIQFQLHWGADEDNLHELGIVQKDK